MGGHKSRSCSVEHKAIPIPTPPPPSPDLIVICDGTPDVAGDYYEHEIYLGQMSYRRSDGAFFVFYSEEGEYRIDEALGHVGGGYYYRYPPQLIGVYQAEFPFVGTAQTYFPE